MSGEIVELAVKEGDRVNKGDLLVKIKPDTYVSGLERAEASLNSANARLVQTRGSPANSKALPTIGIRSCLLRKPISQSDFESAESQYKVAKGDYDAARYSVKSADATLKESRESSGKDNYLPGFGNNLKLNVEKGERVVGALCKWPEQS